MITLEDIAAKVGVSSSTVSRALAGSSLVNERTRRRIVEAAREAGYQVNTVARSLATRTTRSIGLIVPEVANPYYPELIHCVVDRMREAGYSLLLNISGDAQEAEGDCLNSLRERRVDGVLLVAGARGLRTRAELDALRASGVPVVVIGWIDDGAIDRVAGNDEAGAAMLTRHLIDLGHRRIVCLAPEILPGRAFEGRIWGMQTALTDAALPVERSVRSGFSDALGGESDFRDRLAALLAEPDAPTALFAYHDILALKVLSALSELGVAVPRDLSVVGFDNLALAGYVTPRLTTIDYPTRSFAEEAVTLLMRRLRERRETRQEDGKTVAATEVVLTPRLVVRASSGVRGA